ncbi:MAG: glycoside hydrolase family 16 protein, partial [Acidimicrobiia bacterium]
APAPVWLVREMRGAPVPLLAALALFATVVVSAEDITRAAPPSEDDGWTLTFADEFGGVRLDETKWDSGFGWGPRSASTFGYCDPDHSVVGGGVLTQRIERRAQGERPFSVGCINTKRRFAQRYGYWETRMWVPGCRGARGSFWAKPEDGSWPPGLDVVEVRGARPDTARLSVVWKTDDGTVRRERFLAPGNNYAGGYHVFGAQWSPERTVWYVDGVERGRTNAGARALGDGGPFYAILDSQVHSADSTCGEDAESTHQYVDYVRIWSHDAPADPPADPPAPDPKPDTGPEPAADCRPPASGPRAVAELPSGLGEVSGMATSRRYPRVAWLIRDSGNPPSLYAMRLGPSGKPTIREIRVIGADNRDWEEVVHTTGPDGRGRLWIVESGQSGRDRYIYEVLEPDPDKDRRAITLNRYRYAYPDRGYANTEAAFAYGGDLVFVTKTSPARVYRFRRSLNTAGVNRPALVGELRGAQNVSMVRISPDRGVLVAASHKTALVYTGSRSPGLDRLIAGQAASVESLGRGAAVEAGDWLPRSSCGLVLISEHRGVQRLTLTSGG